MCVISFGIVLELNKKKKKSISKEINYQLLRKTFLYCNIYFIFRSYCQIQKKKNNQTNVDFTISTRPDIVTYNIIDRPASIFKYIHLSHTCIDSTTTAAPDSITINEISHEANVADSFSLFSRATLWLHSSRSRTIELADTASIGRSPFYLVELRFRRIQRYVYTSDPIARIDPN